MVMKALRDGASGGVLKFILMGFLLMAVGGLVFMDIGGFFRGGSLSGSNIAKIGKDTVSLNEFDGKLSPLLRQANMTRFDAYQRGYVDQFLTETIRQHVLLQAIDRLGIDVDNEKATANIKAMVDAQAIMGGDPADILNQIMRNQGMNEAQFVSAVKEQIATQTFLETLRGAAQISSEAMMQDLNAYENEIRTGSYVVFKDEDASIDEEPDDAGLLALYEQVKRNFAIPESRDIQTITVTYKAPEGMSEDEALEEIYAIADVIDDMAASGATMQEIADETQGVVKDIEAVSAANDTIDKNVIQSAYALEIGEISSAIEMDDGSLVAVTVTDITPVTYKPFDDVKNDLKKRWIDNRKAMANKLAVLEKVAKINQGEMTLAKAGRVQALKKIKRSEDLPAPFATNARGMIFGAPQNEVISVPVTGGVALVKITDIDFAEPKKDDNTKALKETLAQMNSNEIVGLYLEGVRKDLDIKVNDRLIKNVYATPPTQDGY